MADSVVKLRIDSKEYDANIKRAGDALTEYFRKVREGSRSLDELDADTMTAVKAMGELGTLADNTRGALRELTQATTDMTIAYRNLTDEEKNSPIGQAMAESIQRMTERAGDMRDAMGDVQASINHMASDTRVWDQLSGGTTLVTSSIQSLQGAAKLLGIEMGDNVEVIARLQAAMAVTNGLTQIQNLLQKESAFMQGLNAAKAAMSSAAHALLAGNLSAAAVAQGALNVAMKAAPWAIAAAAIYAVCDALGVFGSSTESAKSSQDDLNRSLNKTKELLRDIETAYSVQQFYTGIMGGQTTGEQLTSERNYLLSEIQKIQDRMNQLNLVSEYPNIGELVLPFNLDEYNELSNKLGELYDKLNLVGKKQVALAEARKKFDAGWESLTDPREIQAAISYYQELSKNLNTSPEYNGTYEVYQDRIAQLQKKLRKPIRPTTSTTGGNSKSIVDDIIPGSIEDLNKRIQDLQKAQSLSITTSQWISYEHQIDRLTEKINILKGVLPKDQEAVFTINTNDEDVINKLRNIEGVKIDDKTLNISTNIGNILHNADELNGINIHDKTFVVTADTQEAMRAVQQVTENIEGVTVDLKVKPVIEPLGNGINIQNKAGLSEYIAQLERDLSVTSFSSTDYQAIERQIADAKMLQTLIGESLKVGLGTALFDIQNDQGLDFWSRVITPDGVENADWQAIADVINAKRKEMGLDAIKLDFGDGSASEVNRKSNTEVMQRLVGGLSSVTSGIQQMGVRIPDNLQKTIGAIQGLMTVIQGVQSIIQLFSTGTATAQVASTTANTIQLGILNSFMPALIASNGLKSIMSPFGFMANGGIVGKAASGMLIPGNSFSGDNLRMPVVGGGVIGVNSGELILSRSQQDSIAAQLESEEPQGVGIQPYVDGEKIFLGMNNTSKRMGRGEIVTTSMLKKFGLI